MKITIPEGMEQHPKIKRIADLLKDIEYTIRPVEWCLELESSHYPDYGVRAVVTMQFKEKLGSQAAIFLQVFREDMPDGLLLHLVYRTILDMEIRWVKEHFTFRGAQYKTA